MAINKPQPALDELKEKAKQIDAVLEYDLQGLPHELIFKISESYREAIKIAQEIGRFEGSAEHK